MILRSFSSKQNSLWLYDLLQINDIHLTKYKQPVNSWFTRMKWESEIQSSLLAQKKTNKKFFANQKNTDLFGKY